MIPGDEIPIEEGADHLGALASAAAKVGYPLLIKASAGGGGKGMRSVSVPKNLRSEFEAAAREASAAFGDGTVYIERLLTRARHCLLYTSPSPRDVEESRMPSSA